MHIAPPQNGRRGISPKGTSLGPPLTPLSAETGSNVRRTNGQILKHKLERGSLRAASNTAAMVATRRLPAFPTGRHPGSASPPPHATLASRRLARPYLGRTCTG